MEVGVLTCLLEALLVNGRLVLTVQWACPAAHSIWSPRHAKTLLPGGEKEDEHPITLLLHSLPHLPQVSPQLLWHPPSLTQSTQDFHVVVGFQSGPQRRHPVRKAQVHATVPARTRENTCPTFLTQNSVSLLPLPLRSLLVALPLLPRPLLLLLPEGDHPNPLKTRRCFDHSSPWRRSLLYMRSHCYKIRWL